MSHNLCHLVTFWWKKYLSWLGYYCSLVTCLPCWQVTGRWIDTSIMQHTVKSFCSITNKDWHDCLSSMALSWLLCLVWPCCPFKANYNNRSSLEPKHIIRSRNHTSTIMLGTIFPFFRGSKAKNFAVPTCHHNYCCCVVENNDKG